MLIAVKTSDLEFVVFSDQRINIAFLIGAVACALAGLLLLKVLHMRWQLIKQARRRKQIRQKAKLILIRLIAGEMSELPTFSPRDLPDFLFVWLHFQELLRGESHLLLNQSLIASGLQVSIRKLLQGSRIEEQLLAASALGHLGDEKAWESLLVLLRNHSPIVSVTALWALVTIDAEKAAVFALPLIVDQQDWGPVRFGLMLRQAKPYLQQALLLYAERQGIDLPSHLLRMLSLSTVLPQNSPLSIGGKFSTAIGGEPEMLGVCLRSVNHPADLTWVRSCFSDRRSNVQVQIAGVLGRMGAPQDTHYLVFLLSSEYWWVRYRAAQALLRQPFINHQSVRRLINNRIDIFARDMLLHIVAENDIC